ncbi:hypothetical protein ACY2L5_001190 [Providencia rettgeri]
MNSLDFTLSLIDNVTQPLKQAQSALSNFANESQKAFTQSAIGVAGLAGALFSLKGLLDPALQMNEALQTASLQGVDAGAMKNVTQAAMKFSAQYGKSSVEFTQSALTIRKAIQGVADNELPYLTTVTNTTATALKSTADEATAYMGQMFSQFSTYANHVGKNQFAEELAGKALYMSQTFGTYSKQEIDAKASAGSGLGYGQTWKDVKSSRALSTTYTNSTGKPILVSISPNGARDHYMGFDCFINNVKVAVSVGYGGESKPQLCFIVPHGSTYKIEYSANVTKNGINMWTELRS